MLTQVKCPTCHKDTAWQGNPHRPFCSERCRLHDLGSWATERYRIPGPNVDREETDAPDDDDSR